MKVLRRPARALLEGCLAGLAVLAIDQLLVFLTRGCWVPTGLRYVAACLVAGAVVAGVVETVFLLRRRPRWGLSRTIAATVVVLYALPVSERLFQALEQRVPLPVAIGAAAVGILGYGLWIVLLGLAARQQPVVGPAALGLGALTVATGLAVNRNLVTLPHEPAALAADVAVLVAALAVAVLIRFAGPRWAGAVVASVAVVAVALTAMPREWGRGTPSLPEASAPHFILVSIDTLRLDVFEDVVAATAEGRAFRAALGKAVWFSNAIATSPWTLPSMGSVMTGLYPQEHGYGGRWQNDPRCRDNPRCPPPGLADSVPTVAERLRANGYRSRALVTNPLLHAASGIARGFDHFEVLAGAPVKLPLLTVLARIGWVKRGSYQPATALRRRLEQQLGESERSRKPIFLWLHFMDPHVPLRAHPDLSPAPGASGLPPREILYRDEVRYLLQELTAIFALLRAGGLWEQAALVLVSDHGEMFPSDGHDNSLPGHKRLLHGHGQALYGELVRVPLVIRPPGGVAVERRVEALVSHTDLYDTIGDLLGLAYPRIGADRVSLAPWLAPDSVRSTPRARSFALIGANQQGPWQRALQTPRLKLIVYPDGDRPDELYDVTSDPVEHRNLAPGHKKQLAWARGQYERLWGQLRKAPARRPVELDEQTRERLKGLGYLEWE